MAKIGPPHRNLYCVIGVLAILLVIVCWGLLWASGWSVEVNLVVMGLLATELALAVLTIGGVGYARGRKWGWRMTDGAVLALYLLFAVFAGRLFFVAMRLVAGGSSQTAEMQRTIMNLSFSLFLIAVLLVLLMLLAVLLRSALWKAEVMLFFKPSAAKEEVRRKMLVRMGAIGLGLIVVSFVVGWILRSR